MREITLAALVAALPEAFIGAMAGGKLSVCSTIQDTDLIQSAFAALTWVQVKGVGNVGETGTKTNILSYNTWDTTVVQKSKGISDAGSPNIEVARLPTDPGQIILRTAAGVNNNYAFKIERNDKPNSNVGSSPTTIFLRGLVTGPTRPNGRAEDFDLEVFELALNQKEIVVDPVTA